MDLVDNMSREEGYRKHLKALFANKSHEEVEAIRKHMEACRKEAEADRERRKAWFDNKSHKQVEEWLQYLYEPRTRPLGCRGTGVRGLGLCPGRKIQMFWAAGRIN
jgi:hypothetical protein